MPFPLVDQAIYYAHVAACAFSKQPVGCTIQQPRKRVMHYTSSRIVIAGLGAGRTSKTRNIGVAASQVCSGKAAPFLEPVTLVAKRDLTVMTTWTTWT